MSQDEGAWYGNDEGLTVGHFEIFFSPFLKKRVRTVPREACYLGCAEVVDFQLVDGGLLTLSSEVVGTAKMCKTPGKEKCASSYYY